MAFDANPGTAALAGVLSRRMQDEASFPAIVDFGSVQQDYSLLTNRFPAAIPQSDYTVCRHLAKRKVEITGGSHGGHESGSGSHSHEYETRALQPGDRVLVVRVGNTRMNEAEFCVVDVILPAAGISEGGGDL